MTMGGYQQTQRSAQPPNRDTPSDYLHSVRSSLRGASSQSLQFRHAMDDSPRVRAQASLQRQLGATAHTTAKKSQTRQKPVLQRKGVAFVDDALSPRVPAIEGLGAGTLQLLTDLEKAAWKKKIKEQNAIVQETNKSIINKAIDGSTGKLKASLARYELTNLIDALEKSIKARKALGVAYGVLGIPDPKNHAGRIKVEEKILAAAKQAKQALPAPAAPAAAGGAGGAVHQPPDTKSSIVSSNAYAALQNDDDSDVVDEKE